MTPEGPGQDLDAFAALFGAAQSFLLSRVGAGVVADLRRAVFAHLLTLSPRFFGEHKTGDLTSRLTSDVGTVQTVTSTALAQLAAQSVSLVGAVVLLVTTSPRLSLLTLAVIPLVIGTAVTIGRRIRRVSREVQDAVAGANASAEEAISGVRVVQSFTAEGVEEGRYGQGVTQSFLAARRLVDQVPQARGAVVVEVVIVVLAVLGQRLPSTPVDEIALSPGDVVVLWTDGLSEPPPTRFARHLIGRHPGALARELVTTLCKPHDDAGCIVLNWME